MHLPKGVLPGLLIGLLIHANLLAKDSRVGDTPKAASTTPVSAEEFLRQEAERSRAWHVAATQNRAPRQGTEDDLRRYEQEREAPDRQLQEAESRMQRIRLYSGLGAVLAVIALVAGARRFRSARPPAGRT